MHPSDGTLRRSLDEPVAVDPANREHMATCARCAERVQRMSADAGWVQAMLPPPKLGVDVPAARSPARCAPRPPPSEGASVACACESDFASRNTTGDPGDGRGRRGGRGQRGARGHRGSPGLPEPLPALAAGARPGHGGGRPLPRRACQLRDGQRRFVDRVSTRTGCRRRRGRGRPRRSRWWRISPQGRRRAEVRGRLGRCRDLHLQRGAGAGGGGARRRAAAGDARGAGRQHAVRVDRARGGGLVRCRSRRAAPAAAACLRARRSSSSTTRTPTVSRRPV